MLNLPITEIVTVPVLNSIPNVYVNIIEYIFKNKK